MKCRVLAITQQGKELWLKLKQKNGYKFRFLSSIASNIKTLLSGEIFPNEG